MPDSARGVKLIEIFLLLYKIRCRKKKYKIRCSAVKGVTLTTISQNITNVFTGLMTEKEVGRKIVN